MGLFKRGPAPPFWRSPSFATSDPDLLYHHGIRMVKRSRGPEMMAAGWAIWGLTGIHDRQAFDFLSDGYRLWQQSGAFDQAEARAFLHDMLGRLQGDPPAPWPNLHQVPPDLVAPVAGHYGARCWAVSELVALLDPVEQERLGPELFDAVRRARYEFVPPRSMAWARSYASSRGLPDPWS